MSECDQKHMTTNETTQTYPPPPTELIEDIRKRLAEIPRELAHYVDEALKRKPIEEVANRMWKEGHSVLMLNELYEYRRTLFPADSLVEPYTAGPPVLRPEFAQPATEPVPMEPGPKDSGPNHEPTKDDVTPAPE